MLMANLLEDGLLLFNDGKYYEAHEAWEDLWRVTLDPRLKTCYQGLIQAAVGLHHLHRGNRVGAGSQLSKSMHNLSGPGGALTTTLDIPDLIQQLAHILKTLPDRSGEPGGPAQPVRIARLK